MKNLLKAFGIIAFVAVIGFSFSTCGGDDSGGGEEDTPILTLTFVECEGWNDPDKQDWDRWEVFYQDEGKTFDISDALSKNKVYAFTYSFTSNVDIDRISACFMHKKPDWSERKDDITDYAGLATDVKKNTKFSGKEVITPKSGASGLSKENIYLHILIHNRNVNTPATLTFYKFSLELVDNENGSGGGGTAPAITTASLPNGTVGTAYSQTLTATGDTPITWTLDSGTLPTGLILSTTGTISGTPTAAATSTFTVKATNAAGNITKTLSITIAASSSGGGDTMTWTLVDVSSIFGSGSGASDVVDIAYSGSRFVAVAGAGKMAYSDNGTTWTAVTDSKFDTTKIRCIAYGGGKFVAGGDNKKMAYSADGTTWTPVTDSKFEQLDYIMDIAYGNNMFVAVSLNGRISYSDSTGTSWTAVSNTAIDGNIYSIAYNGSRFVAGSDKGKMAFSDNGTSWTAVGDSKFGTSAILSIAGNNNRFVAGGSSNKSAYSTNGETWTAFDSDTLGNNPQGIAYVNNKFIAWSGVSNSRIKTSQDGLTWTDAGLVSNSQNALVNCIAWGSNKYVAGLSNGRIAYSSGN